MFMCMFDESAVLDGLNEQQRRAVTHQGGPLLVLAGAGTGKTRTLVARAAWLRGSQGVPASRILLLTFTRRAASDMLARAAAWFDGSPQGAERICGGTFHAIAHRIIRQHAESFSLPPQFTILDQGDVTDLLDVLRPDHGLDNTGQRAPRAAVCADIYTRCVNTGRPVSEVATASFPWCVPFTGQLAGLFRAYTARKRAGNLLDFDDLLLLWQAALADPVAGPVLRGMFDAVLVDEYQDVNAIQASIVRLLQPDGKQLTCVGDDAQAIYGFRGADPAHLRQLTADYQGLDVVRLDRNYRSRQGVLDLANLIRPSSSRPWGARGGRPSPRGVRGDGSPREGSEQSLDLTLTADRGAGQSGESGSAPLLVRCHDEATQAREICARVLEAHEDGAALRDQAVLIRAAHHSDILEIELSARKIPYVKFGGLRFTDTAHVKDFLAAARILANPADELAWFRLLRLHEGVGPVHARRVLDALAPDPDSWERAAEVVGLAPARSRRALTATVGRLADAAQQPAAQQLAAAQAAAVLALLDPLIRARYPDAPARLADLQRLADAAAAQPSLHDALAELTLDPPVSASDLAGPPRLDEDYLTISTIHAAKGLEWPIVHLPHLVDGALPSDMALGDPGGLAEEHRLFYVAVTRARDHLYLYAPQRLHYHRRGRDDRHGFGQLTRFLDAGALAACDSVTAAPLAPVLPAVGSLATKVDTALGALWDG
jgi:DNA helicase II / ATP-dependent DNA helicase PcrA